MKHQAATAALVLLAVTAAHINDVGLPMGSRAETHRLKGYDITPTGLTPEYPAGYRCSRLTSLYASWRDVDGSARDEPHSGVDGGRLGERVVAPGPGTVQAVWRANWGWGWEGALLISHSREDLNLADGSAHYYSAFYHLRHRDLSRLAPGQAVARGQRIGRVHRPGGKRAYLPEVHWEVYEVDDKSAIKWGVNRYGAPYWRNRRARLVDPLFLLGLEKPIAEEGRVLIQPYVPDADYGKFRGFTYILPCTRR